MNVASLEFLVGLFVLGAGYFYLPGYRERRCLLFLLNTGVVYAMLPNTSSWLVLGVFLIGGYGVALWGRLHPTRMLVPVYIAALTAVFVFLKRYDFLLFLFPASLLEHTIAIVGLSYMFFRQIHFVVDMVQGQIQAPSFWTYLNYQLNFFALLSGPIQRYQDFQKYWASPVPLLVTRKDVLRAYLRLLTGTLKIVLIADLCLSLYDRIGFQYLSQASQVDRATALHSIARFLGMLYSYPLYVYFNFAGYCDVVIAGASLVGLRLPENFDRPYLSRNLIDFWTRWHRTLGLWVRDYIFTPLYMSLAKRRPKAAPSLAFACYFIAFFLVGMWHGTTLKVVVFALLHGLGVSAAKLWETFIIRRSGRPGLRRYMESRFVRVIAILSTVHYFAFSVLFFPTDLVESATPLHMLIEAFRGWRVR